MTKKYFVFAAALLLGLSAIVRAEPACVFKDSSNRLISPDNPEDWACMKLRAAQGDPFYQFYVGLQLISGFDPAGGDYKAYEQKRKGNPDGIRLLQSAARSKNHAIVSANAMNTLGRMYASPDSGVQNFVLSYQWQYLASRQKLYSAGYFFDENVLAHLSQDQIKTLQRQAEELLQLP